MKLKGIIGTYYFSYEGEHWKIEWKKQQYFKVFIFRWVRVNLKLKLLLECHSWPHWKKNDLRDFFLFCPKNNYFSGTTKKERRILVFNIFFAGFIFFAFFGVFLFIGSKSENIDSQWWVKAESSILNFLFIIKVHFF